MIRRALILLASSTVLLCPSLRADARSNDAKALLIRAAQAYRDLHSYEFEGRSISETIIAGKTTRSEVGFVVAYQAPNKMRLEYRYPTAGSWVRVSDGEFSLVTRTLTKESRRSPATERTLQTLNSSPIYIFQDLYEHAENPHFLPPETILVGGRLIDCQVVRFATHPMALRPSESAGTSTVWVDKQSGIILKQEIRTSGESNSEGKRTILVERFVLNSDLDSALFSTRPHHGEGASNRK